MFWRQHFVGGNLRTVSRDHPRIDSSRSQNKHIGSQIIAACVHKVLLKSTKMNVEPVAWNIRYFEYSLLLVVRFVFSTWLSATLSACLFIFAI